MFSLFFFRSNVSSEISDEDSEQWAKGLDLPGFDDNVSQNNIIIYLFRINIAQVSDKNCSEEEFLKNYYCFPENKNQIPYYPRKNNEQKFFQFFVTKQEKYKIRIQITLLYQCTITCTDLVYRWKSMHLSFYFLGSYSYKYFTNKEIFFYIFFLKE